MKREAENVEQAGRLHLSQMNALKLELAESKRQLELKTKEAKRFEQELFTTRQATGKSREADLQLKVPPKTLGLAASKGIWNLILCERQ